MPRISVVVPIYNVERYLEPCLESLAGQTVTDLEAVLVDDGSTDGSSEIAEAFARRDERFHLIRQPNGGLSRARNTGIDAATGEFLAFLDSDDMLPPNAYELLLGALDRTGSDFASGNVHRLSQWSRTQSRFVAKVFTETRLKTHVTKFRPLLADRTAWNKLWRRSFWDRHGLRFPEGVVHEDIPVVVPAHFMAGSVDVLADPVYLYRVREDGNLSITQRRLEQRVLLDRLAAIEHVSGYLADHGPRRSKRWYDESAVADDLRLHLNILDHADDAYQQLFLERVNGYLDGVDRRVFAPLLAIDRLKWHLVRRRLMPELVEVLRFQRDELTRTPPVRIRGRWYGDYPFRTDRRLGIPLETYRLDAELALQPSLEEIRREGDTLHLRGHAHVQGLGVEARNTQTLRLIALRAGPLRRVRLRISGIGLATNVVHRPDLNAHTPQALQDVSWAGFEATLDVRRLRRAGRWVDATWELYATARIGRLRRRRGRFTLEPGNAIRALDLDDGDAHVEAAASVWGRVTVEVRTRRATLRGCRRDGGALELTGELQPPGASKGKLEVLRKSDARKRTYPLTIEPGGGFSARVPFEDLHAAAGEQGVEEGELDERVVWELTAIADGRRLPLVHPADLPEAEWPARGREIALFRTRQGDAALVERDPCPLVTEVGWAADGALEVAGTLPAGVELDAVSFVSPEYGDAHPFPVRPGAEPGRFAVRLEPERIETLAGTLPLPEGPWQLRSGSSAAGAPLVLSRALHERLPLRALAGRKPLALGLRGDDTAMLYVGDDLGDDERGEYNQRRLRDEVYAPRRREPLRDAVVYTSFGGRQYSDSPRAIHEELVRRGAPLEHLWVVRDAQCAVPPTAAVLREGSREHHEALARARFVIGNDHFPDWFERRDDQLGLQTWHGTPFKRLGFDVADVRRTARGSARGWDRQQRNWQYVLSPNAFSTPIMRRAYAIEGEILETGYPRVDRLVAAGREERERELRRRLGIPDGVRTVLYAPTYRDHVIDRTGRYRLEDRLDVERLRAALGPDTVLLYRKHHAVADAVPTTGDGFVRDVSAFPDGAELLLAADVLVTDYSAAIADFANTGRPIVLYAYDLDAYRDEIRGFTLDFAATVPGPLVRTCDELADALRDLDAVQRAYAERYAAFRSRFCALDDGRAAARVVERLLGEYGS